MPQPAASQSVDDSTPKYVTVGLFIASIEEGARIFTPTRLLPFDHPESLGHDFPTVLQFHRGEDRLLVTLGREAGLLLAVTLQRYPVEPDSLWPYNAFRAPPAERFNGVKSIHRREAPPLPGLRAVAYLDGFPLAFIIDTRGMTLMSRHMTRATSAGLDVRRKEILTALDRAARGAPKTGAFMVVYDTRRAQLH